MSTYYDFGQEPLLAEVEMILDFTDMPELLDYYESLPIPEPTTAQLRYEEDELVLEVPEVAY